MKSEDCVGVVIFTVKESSQLFVLQLGLEGFRLLLYLLDVAFIVSLDRELDEGDDVLEILVELIVLLDLLLKDYLFLELKGLNKHLK